MPRNTRRGKSKQHSIGGAMLNDPHRRHLTPRDRDVNGVEKLTTAEMLSIIPSNVCGSKLYDEIRKVEDRFGIRPETLINIVRKRQEGRWGKAPVDTSDDNGSFHMWLEDEDGDIIDPHFEEFVGMMKMPNCDSREKVYSKWTDEEQKEKLTNLIPGIVRIIKRNCDVNGLGMREMMMILALRPQFRCCPMNAWCMKSVFPELKVCIGNMGFRSKDDPEKIWWEY